MVVRGSHCGHILACNGVHCPDPLMDSEGIGQAYTVMFFLNKIGLLMTGDLLGELCAPLGHPGA